MKHEHPVVDQIYTYTCVWFSPFVKRTNSWLFTIELYHFKPLFEIIFFKQQRLWYLENKHIHSETFLK